MFGWMLMAAAMATPTVDLVRCEGDEAVWLASLEEGRLSDRTAQPLDVAEVAATWSGGRLVPSGPDQATVAWEGCADGPRRSLAAVSAGVVPRREALALVEAVAGPFEAVSVVYPVGAVPVAQRLVTREGELRWSLFDAAGVEVLAPAAVIEAPRWVEVEAGEPGRWLGWAPTADGLVVVHLGDGAVESLEVSLPARPPSLAMWR